MSKSGFAKDHLRSFIERIERLEEEKAALAADIREVYSEAKGTGFDTKIMRQVIRQRKLDAADRQEQAALLDLYLDALGMGDGPLLQHGKEGAGAAALAERAKQRTSESMSDHKEMSAELRDVGLISAEPHEENVRIADAVAKKFGADRAAPEDGAADRMAPAAQSGAATWDRTTDVAVNGAPKLDACPQFDPERDLPDFLRRGRVAEASFN